MSLSTRYSPKETEERWYAHWEAKNYFHSEPDEREPFTIVIPPPNVTGVLHMGHMLNNTIQDVLIRRARMQGKNACWVPGTDHASIATEAKVVQLLRKQGIKKGDIPREEFLKHAFDWKEKYGGIILDQLKKLGASCDWQRTRFTMEESMSKAVIHVFVDLHKKGKLYRGLRMTNWDPEAKTVLSNEEVIHREENSQLFHIKYNLVGDPNDGIVIATQRPETIMADVAIAVHPEEEKYKHLVGKMVLIPLINKPIPIIADSYVDREFGSGALKITPAHDQNDLQVGERHGLPVVDILTEDGKLNAEAQILVGEDRFAARKKIRKLLEDAGNLVKVEDYRTSIGHSERTDAVVEPRLTNQWFLKMGGFAATALEAVKSGEVKFYPEGLWNMYYQWLQEDNVRDWCISRQLWWGQRIPAWYILKSAVCSGQWAVESQQFSESGRWIQDGEEVVIVAENAVEALAQAKLKTGNSSLTINDLQQDEDVVDTWFSSWLWPIAVFDGFEKTDELKYYYPTNVLVTGWDIMFFWVARMIMAGYEWSEELLGKNLKGKMPFHEVYFTGMVRDSKRRKMSKSLGNSPDALELIENYGADGVRFGMLLSGSAGNDIIFDAPIDPVTKEVVNESKLCEQGRNFCNKMWNALRLIKGWERSDAEQPEVNALAVAWMKDKFDQTLAEVEANFTTYRLGDVLMGLYQTIWDDFCSFYLEIIKPAFNEDGTSEPIDHQTLEATIHIFEKMMAALHPFMPFVTEEIWHQLRDRKAGNDCVVAAYPSAGRVDKDLIQKVDKAKDLITKIRESRSSKGISPKESLRLFAQNLPSTKAMFELNGLAGLVQKMGNLSELAFTDEEPAGTVSLLSGTEKYFLEMNITIDVDTERERITKELDYYRGFVASVEKKLSNEKFVGGAPAAVIDAERKKLTDGQEKMRILEEGLVKLTPSPVGYEKKRRKTLNTTGISRIEGIPYHDAWVAYKCVSCHEMNYVQVGQELITPSQAIETCVWKCEHCGFVHSKESDLPFENWEEEYNSADSTTALGFWEGFFRIATEHSESYWKQCNVCSRILPFNAFNKHIGWGPLERQMECRSCKGAINAVLNPKRSKEQLHESAVRRRIADLFLEEANQPIDFEDLFKRFDSRCFKTKVPLDIKKRDTWAIDHILPSKYLYPLSGNNAALLSRSANENKRDKWPSKFYDNNELIELARIAGANLELISRKTPLINHSIDVNKGVERYLQVREKSDLPKRIKEIKKILQVYELVENLSEANKKLLGFK